MSHKEASPATPELTQEEQDLKVRLCQHATEILDRIFDNDTLPEAQSVMGSNVSFKRLALGGMRRESLNVVRYRYPTLGRPGEDTYSAERETWFAYDPLRNRISSTQYDKAQENDLLEKDDYAGAAGLRQGFEERLVTDRANLTEISYHEAIKLNDLLGVVKRTSLMV